jgi:ACR3 family arsenite efflux pump ArsB
MPAEFCIAKEAKGLVFFEKYLASGILSVRYRNPTRTFRHGTGPLPRCPRVEDVIATATILSGLVSVATLTSVAWVLIEVPTMFLLVKKCLRTQGWFT